MNATVDRALYWSPRVLAIVFAAFISVFALDVFGQGSGFWSTLFALAMHLIPTLIVVVVLVAAWRHELVGALVFIGLGALYLTQTWGRFPLITYLTIAGPLFLIGGLFLVGWVRRRRRA